MAHPTTQEVPEHRSTRASALILAVVISGCCATATPPSLEWISIDTDAGHLAIPAGWNVRFFESPSASPRMFWFWPPSKGMVVIVAATDTQGLQESSLEDWLREFTANTIPGRAPGLRRFVKRDGTVHCAIVEGVKVYATCAFWRRGPQPGALAFAYVVGTEHGRFIELGGLDLLAHIAASGRGFVAERHPLRKAP